MTFREMMELYKEGKLDDAKKMKLEGEIEKHEAISDYLYENEQIPSVAEILGKPDNEKTSAGDESFADKMAAIEQKSTERAQDFAKKIRSEMKKMMIKTGAVVLTIVLVAVILVTQILPKIADNFYYKPKKEDFELYASLFLPDRHYDDFSTQINRYDVESYGWGCYDVRFTQWKPDLYGTSFGTESVFSIHIDKNKISNDYDGFFKIDEFSPFFDKTDGLIMSQYGGRDFLAPDMEKKFNTMTTYERYNAYVTFEKPMTLKEFNKWMNSNDLNIQRYWLAFCCKSPESESDYYYAPETIGMDFSDYFSVDDDLLKEIEEDYIKKVRSYAGNEEFMGMMDEYRYGNEIHDSDPSHKEALNKFADNLEKNGIYVYGIYIHSFSGESLRKIYDKNEEIEYMVFEQ